MTNLILWVLLAGGLVLNGCATRINVTEQSIGAEGFTPAPTIPHYARPIVFVRQVAANRGGMQQPVGDQFLRQVKYKLQESELFSDVTFQKPWAKPITIKLSVEDFHDRHAATNMPKAILTGLSLFLLSPILPIYEEYHIDVAAEVTSPEGQTKLYRAKAKSEMYCMVMETQNAIRDMYATSVNRALNSLVSQMLMDQPLLAHKHVEPWTLHMGSRVPYGIWTDNAKWIRTDSTPPREMAFTHTKGDAYALVIADRIQIPLETMKRVVISNAESLMQNQVVTENELRTVNGQELLYIRMHGNVDGVPMEYMVYVISGRMGTVQLFTFTGGNLIAQHENDFFEFLNGFVIEPMQRAPETTMGKESALHN